VAGPGSCGGTVSPNARNDRGPESLLLGPWRCPPRTWVGSERSTSWGRARALPRRVEAAMRLLVVDDSDLVRRMYGLAFYRHKHELVEADSGRQALDLLGGAERPFDLILLDLRMPDMNGVEFLQAVQRRPLFKIPIVVVTAEPETSELLRQARTLG